MSLLAFLVAVAYFPGVPEATTIGRWWVAAVGAALLLYRIPRLRLMSAHWWGATLLAWCALSLLWSTSPWDSVGSIVQLLTLAGVFCAAAEGERTGRGLLDVPLPQPVVAFGLGLLPSAAASVAQALGYSPVLSISNHPVGLFLSKNGATEAALPVFVWCAIVMGGDALGRRCTPDAWPRRALVLLAGASALLIVALAQANEVWLMFAGAALVVALHWARWEDERMYPRIPVNVGGVLAITGGITLLGITIVAMQPESVAQVTYDLNDRLAIWQATLAIWWMHPLLGWGFGTFSTVLPGMEYAHNEFAQMLFETGPIGLALLAAFLVAVFRARADGAGVCELVAGRSALAALLASALVWWPFHGPASGFLVALLAGRLAGAGAGSRAAEPLCGGDGSEGVRQAVWPGRAAEVGAASPGGYGVAIES